VAVRRVVPNVFDADPAATRAFYTGVFAFDVAMDLGWITTLASPDHRHAQISVFGTDGEAGRDPFISIEVDDVDAVHATVAAAGVAMPLDLRSEDFGQRHFIAVDPAGTLVDVITPIEPSPEYAAFYATAPTT
jgi:catechol 2,3-dioxygenase-like lactoylglutathione lyase family enzyme